MRVLDRFILGLASVGYIGFFPWIPGTVGTVAGVAVFFLYSALPPVLYVVSTAGLTALACWASGKAEILLGRKDDRRIVIDEVAGYLVTMAFLPRTWAAVVGGFLFFRLLDIMKPFPAGRINDRMPGGPGVVLDDVVAGLYANLLLHAASLFRPEIALLLDR